MALPYPVEPLSEIRKRTEPHVRVLTYAILLEAPLRSTDDGGLAERTTRENLRNLIGANRDRFSSYSDVCFASEVRNQVAHPTRHIPLRRADAERACKCFDRGIQDVLRACSPTIRRQATSPRAAPIRDMCPVCEAVLPTSEPRVLHSRLRCASCGYHFEITCTSPLVLLGPIDAEDRQP